MSGLSVLGEVSDKVPQIMTFWAIGAVGAAAAAVARYHWWTRGAMTVAAAGWAGLNVLDVMLWDGNPLGQAIVSEMGWGYLAQQFAAALLPLAMALVPVRRHCNDRRRGFEVIAKEQTRQ
jgi:hypothetical protein